jgi:hypothetical protein
LSSADWTTFNSKQPAGNYVTLDTVQTITAQKTFTTSGGSDSVIITTTGAGFALDAIKAGNGEVIRVNKTSGTGNAMTVIGGNFEAPTIVKTGGTSSQFLKADGSVDSSTYLTTGSAASIYLPLAGGTLTGALNGTSGTFTGAVISTAVSVTATTGIAGDFTNNSSTNETLRARNNGSGNIAAFRNLSAEVASITNSGGLTLSGALNGTTGTFSTASGNNQFNIVAPSGSSPYITLTQTGTVTYAIVSTPTTGDFQISEAGFDYRFQIAKTTGAATFNSANQSLGGSYSTTGNILISSTDSFAINKGGSLSLGGKYNTAGTPIETFARIHGKKENSTDGDTAGYLTFETVPDATALLTERMRINSVGNVGIGTASPASGLSSSRTLNIYGGASTGGEIVIEGNSGGNFLSLNAGTSSGDLPIVLFNRGLRLGHATSKDATGFVESMRITSGGYLKAANNGVYNNATGAFHEFNQNLITGQVAVFRNSATSVPQGIELAFTGADPNDTGSYMLGAYTTSGGFTWIYRIFSNGTVSARSDARWKKNIETTRNGYIEDLCKLRVVKYNWYNHEDDTPKELGLIAQEVEEVFPNLIQIDPVIAKREVEQEDGTIIEEEFEDGVSRSIKTSVLPFMLLKAIQEQQAQIEELKVQIDSLKNQIK